MSAHPTTTTPTLPTGDSAELWLLKKRHEDLTKIFINAWTLYIQFYTVFLTFNVGAMGWILSHNNATRVNKVVAVVFSIQCLLSAGTSIAMASYSRRLDRDHFRVESAILGLLPSRSELNQTSAIPVKLAMWGGWANALGMLAMIIAWLYVGR
jgi:hypothetical protein